MLEVSEEKIPRNTYRGKQVEIVWLRWTSQEICKFRQCKKNSMERAYRLNVGKAYSNNDNHGSSEEDATKGRSWEGPERNGSCKVESETEGQESMEENNEPKPYKYFS